MFRPIRDVGVPVAVTAAAFSIGVSGVVAAFVTLGYAHFIQGYWYRVRRGGTDWVQLSVVPLSVIAAFVGYYVLFDAITPMFVITPFIFAAHFAFDEYFLHKETVTGVSRFVCGGFMLVASVLSIGLVLPSVMFVALSISSAVLLCMVFALYWFGSGASDRYLTSIAALFVVLGMLGEAELILGVIVLLHCINWYVWGYERARITGTKGYVRDVCAVLGFFVLVYVVVQVFVPQLGFLYTVPDYHYLYFPLALAHIATSVRFSKT